MTLLTGTWTLAAIHLRTRWRSLAVGVALLAGLVIATAWSIEALYPTLTDRLGYAASVGAAPSVAAFNGRGYDLAQTGGIVSYEVGFMALLAIPMVTTLLAIRLTRTQEDAGRAELISAAPVGRLAQMSAAVVVLVLFLSAFVVACGVGLQVVGLPTAGSWKYAAALGLFGLAHGAIGVLIAQLSRDARTASTLALAVVMLTFLVRALVDGRNWDLTWVSPSGWLAQARPWGQSQWWPYLGFVALSGLSGALAAWMQARRDLGSGLVASRPGPARGSAVLGTPVGLAWRFLRGPFLGWGLGTLAWAVAFGALAGEMTDLVSANPSLVDALGLESPEHLVTTLALLLGAVGAAALGVQAFVRLAHEESSGRLALLLASAIPRRRLWAAWAAVTLASVWVVLLGSALTLGGFAAWSTGSRANVSDALAGGLAMLIPVTLVVALAAALHALRPGVTTLAWTVVAWAVVVGMLAETLRLPEWARDLSPLYAAGQVPMEDPRTVPLVLMSALVIALAAVAVAGFGRRDLVAG